MSSSLTNIQPQSLWVGQGSTAAGGGGGGVEAPRCSYVEAFSTAARSLDVGIIEDKLT